MTTYNEVTKYINIDIKLLSDSIEKAKNIAIHTNLNYSFVHFLLYYCSNLSYRKLEEEISTENKISYQSIRNQASNFLKMIVNIYNKMLASVNSNGSELLFITSDDLDKFLKLTIKSHSINMKFIKTK